VRPFDSGRLPLRIAAAVLVCVPASFAVALVNDYFFTIYDQSSLLEMDVIIPNGDYDRLTRIVEVAIWSYFFLIAWSALYLAIGYAQTVRTAERRAASFERAAQLAELRALRYQLNPHFLFNTLNSLSALVLSGRGEAAEAMILNLSTFYRTSLSGDPSGDVSLADEIALQKLYLDIEQVRFPDRLNVVIDIPEALAEHKVPGLILQPLVENAIKHGVARTNHPVEVRISARREDGMLLLEVSDNAPLGASVPGSGIGLSNVLERLMARYGAVAGVQTTEGAERGYCALLTLPSSFSKQVESPAGPEKNPA
jgi:two-component system, LytTR family, sensor kinase